MELDENTLRAVEKTETIFYFALKKFSKGGSMESGQIYNVCRIVLLGAGMLFASACSTHKAPEIQSTGGQRTLTKQAQMNPSAKAAVSQTSSSSLDQLKQGTRIGTGASDALKDVYFDFDKYDLRSDARDTLKADAEWLKKNPSATVQIEGHCDDRGTAEYNLALGAKRAQTAKDYLVTLGVAAQRMTTISYGEELPVCRDELENCWQKNRHDRFVVKSSPTS
jgi:peptidoglycan-associated lipoprotein